MNLTFTQKVLIFIAVLGVLSTSGANLTTLVGTDAATLVISMATLLMSLASAVLAVVTGQAGYIKEVRSMPGVENILVNAKANPTLAGIAMDPAETKVVPTPEAAAKVSEIART